MEAVVLVMCLVAIPVTIVGMHLYTTSKINKVQRNTVYGSKDWKDLEKGIVASIVTVLLFILFYATVAIPMNKVTTECLSQTTKGTPNETKLDMAHV